MTAASMPLPSGPRTALRDLFAYVSVEQDPEALSIIRARLHGVVRALDRALEGSALSADAPVVAEVVATIDLGTDVSCTIDGAEIDLSRRRLGRSFLRALGIARIERPNQPMTWSDLTAAVWPGEQMLPMAARNRVKVTIAWLRRAGLRDVIASDARGYWLTDACVVSTTEVTEPRPDLGTTCG